MRAEATAERTLTLLTELGRATSGARLYLTGGASAVLVGWRERTVDVDIRLDGDEDRLLRAISTLKDRLDINIELAGPLDFLPPASTGAGGKARRKLLTWMSISAKSGCNRWRLTARFVDWSGLSRAAAPI